MDQSKETKTAAQPQTNHSAANIVLQEVEIPQNTNRQSPVTPNAQVNGSSDKRQAKYKKKFFRDGERHPLWKDPLRKNQTVEMTK